MRLNLGCGSDVRPGYVNVDKVTLTNEIVRVDLSEIPWPWKSGEVEEILMLDFLEHFPYRQTDIILQEAWRVLRVGGTIEVQVPDFEHCALAALDMGDYLCNFCGTTPFADSDVCHCGKFKYEIADAAIKRLYGGQDYEGNFHFTAFTKDLFVRRLKQSGFGDIVFLERNENGETFHQNWNIKAVAVKQEDAWD